MIEDIRKIAEISYDSCDSCTEADKEFYINGYTRGYLHGRDNALSLNNDDRDAIQLLKKHQQWRLGFIEDMPCTPKELTAAINLVISKLELD
jgi:hypothetical protein